MTRTIRTFIGAAALLFASAAVAGTVGWPGTLCVGTGGATISIRSDGQAENATASAITVVCPVERIVTPVVSTTLSGVVNVVDQHPTSDVCCQLVSLNGASGTRIQSSPVCSQGSSSASQSLNLGQIVDPYSYSHFFIQCDVPPAQTASTSRIQSYQTTQ